MQAPKRCYTYKVRRAVQLKKILFGFIFVALLASESQGLSSLRIGEGSLMQPDGTAAAREGLSREYYDDGVLKRETNFKDGQVHGPCRLYYKEGGLRKQVNYEEGILQGKAYELYENGQYKVESNYIDGKADGESKIYYENGNLYKLLVFESGQLVKSFVLDAAGRPIKY